MKIYHNLLMFLYTPAFIWMYVMTFIVSIPAKILTIFGLKFKIKNVTLVHSIKIEIHE